MPLFDFDFYYRYLETGARDAADKWRITIEADTLGEAQEAFDALYNDEEYEDPADLGLEGKCYEAGTIVKATCLENYAFTSEPGWEVESNEGWSDSPYRANHNIAAVPSGSAADQPGTAEPFKEPAPTVVQVDVDAINNMVGGGEEWTVQ